MEIKNFVEREDGGADVVVDMTPEEHVAMVQLGILTAIKLGIAECGDQPTDKIERKGETE